MIPHHFVFTHLVQIVDGFNSKPWHSVSLICGYGFGRFGHHRQLYIGDVRYRLQDVMKGVCFTGTMQAGPGFSLGSGISFGHLVAPHGFIKTKRDTQTATLGGLRGKLGSSFFFGWKSKHDQQNDEANHWNEHQQLPPATSTDVMEPASSV